MVPTITDRLASLQRALQDFIIPAIPADAPLALEQAKLSWLHVSAMRDQIDIYAEVERKELQDAQALARQIGAGSVADDALQSDILDPAMARALRMQVLAAIDARIAEKMSPNSEADWDCLKKQVIAYQRVRCLEERRWFAGFGMG